MMTERDRFLAHAQPREQTDRSSPRLSLCMIVRDNARTIVPCLESIRPWVDEIIVVDTGSVDGTPEICARLGAKVFHFPWTDDFSAARNVSLSHATGQWLFWMDSDDAIDEVNGRKLRQLVDGPHAAEILGYVMQVHCPAPAEEGDLDTVVDHVKLFRNLPGLRFEGPIHEQILPSIRGAGGEVEWTDIFVVHSGSEHSPAAKQKKCARDLRILKADIQQRPEHPFVLFNLGMTHNDMGNHEEAANWLKKSLQVAREGESHVRKAYALLIGSLAALQRPDEALEWCDRGQQLFPLNAELWFRRGIVLHDLGRLADAIAAYRQALHIQEPRHFTSIDPGIAGHKARHNLAVIYGEDGQQEQAELQWRLVLETAPHFRAAWYNLGECLLRQGKWNTMEVFLKTMPATPRLRRERWLLEAELARVQGKPEVVRSLLQELRREGTADLRVDRLWCRYLFDHGTLAEAEEALGQLLRDDPGHPGTLHNLGIVYYRQNKLEQAADLLRQSLQFRRNSVETRDQLALVEQELSRRAG